MNTKYSQWVKYLRDNYPALGPIRNIILLEHNNINSTNYILTAGDNKYVLRHFTDGSTPDKMEKICRILIFCLDNQANVIQPIKNKFNCYADRRRNLYLTRYYEGESYDGTNAGLQDAARNLAVLHLALSRVPIRYNYRGNHGYYQHTDEQELAGMETIIKHKQAKDEIDEKVLENLEYLTKSFSENALLSQRLIRANEIKQLIHYDFHPGNVIVKNNRVVAILDFNAMRKGETIEDVAFASFRFSCSGENHPNEIKKRIKLFIDNYLQYNDVDRPLACLDYYLIHKILGRLSFILRRRYFSGSDSWSIDFNKNLGFLKLAREMCPLWD
jgi:Ser/Thr protein kinase RdoA (MazF antagonist)